MYCPSGFTRLISDSGTVSPPHDGQVRVQEWWMVLFGQLGHHWPCGPPRTKCFSGPASTRPAEAETWPGSFMSAICPAGSVSPMLTKDPGPRSASYFCSPTAKPAHDGGSWIRGIRGSLSVWDDGLRG